MRTIRLLVEYDGTLFGGWQTQPNARSVQEEITGVLTRILREDIDLVGAGRTDAGVHARGQVASFTAGSAMAIEQIQRALNALLPEDIRIGSASEAPPGFHARFDATSRLYRYRMSTVPCAIGRQYVWQVPYALDRRILADVAGQIPGEHDFGSFARTGTEVNHNRCTVYLSRWLTEGDVLVYEIRANRFLRGMVRALVGTMVDIARGRFSADAYPAILAARDRSKAGTSAPPMGLSLEEVTY